MSESTGFDELLVKDFNLEFDFDETKFIKFLAKAKMPLGSVKEQALYELGCGEFDGKKFVINNTCALFFAVQPQRFVGQSYITCARYQGNSMASVIDRKDLEGDLLTLADEAEDFVKRHTRLAYRFDGFNRIDIEEYPYDAIKEAIINAVCHRNYFERNNVFVNVFDDRVEIISPGSIPNNLSIKQVYGESHPRNFKIVDLFKKIGYIEKLGSGLKRMEELMLFHGLKKPSYASNPVSFKVIFEGPKDKILELVKPSNKLDLREIGLNERQIKALHHLQAHGFVTRKHYQEIFKVSKMTASRDLKLLIQKSMVKSKGKSVSAQYFLNQ